MDYFPAFMNLKSRECVIVGGGQVALRKARLLASANAQLVVIAPDICKELKNLKQVHTTHQREFRDADIDNATLLIVATNDTKLNEYISRLAHLNNLPVNVVDNPSLCSFITPSIVDRSPIVVAISSGGSAPVLARSLRARLESYIPPEYGQLAASMGELRAQVKSKLPNERARRIFWEKIVNGPIAKQFLRGNQSNAIEQLHQAVDSTDNAANVKTPGSVALVGAGPGNPDLLTFRALRLMQSADVILHDRLVSPEIVDLCRRDAERIYVGKQRDNHALPQPKINQLLIELAQQGNSVVRLKGGDPFIFGRGGEEIEGLAEAGIPFEVVPGITAASGCASYSGIPLTHRNYAQSCVFVTGHLKNGTVNLDWQKLANPDQTIVVYMGLEGLPNICRELINHGLADTTPAALIEQGTTPQQQVITGDLNNLAELVSEKSVTAPTLMIIGGVVNLYEKLSWFSVANK
ncbi:MAG TPA: uroporphyrinogen-III C-methyltransferase [Gammaproteobacteria bacterium]|mgnify:FL=1|nr:uroporphyrinogen-III C-methyltransferase [Gammaproteobacteria bacterium]